MAHLQCPVPPTWKEFFAICDEDPEETSDDPRDLSPESNASELADLLTSLKYAGRLNSKEVCLIAYWASRAGAALTKTDCTVWQLGMEPGLRHYSRHFDDVTGAKSNQRYLIKILIPISNKYDGERRIANMPVAVVHELLANELQQNNVQWQQNLINYMKKKNCRRCII